MKKRTLHIAALTLAASTAIATLSQEAAAQTTTPAHVTWAESIVFHVLPENNAYSTTPTTVNWSGERIYSTTTKSYTDTTAALATSYVNSSVCNSFLTKILQKAYGWDERYMISWIGQASPYAQTYYDKIAGSPTATPTTTGWIKITSITNVQIGDIIAIKYLDGATVTGHVMIVDAAPTVMAALNPIQANTVQYAVDVLDSSSSVHGTFDTRVLATGNDTGAGRGTLRIYANTNGTFAGYSWSNTSGSPFIAPSARILTVGRLVTSTTLLAAKKTNTTTSNDDDDDDNGTSGSSTLKGGVKGGYDYPMDPEY